MLTLANRCRAPLAALLLLGIASPAPGQPKTGAKAKAAAPKGVAAAKQGAVRALVPFAHRDELLTLAPAPSPMVGIGAKIFDTQSGKQVGMIADLSKDPNSKYALSPSGRYFVQTKKKMYHEYLEVVDTTTGAAVHELEYAAGDFKRVSLLTFTMHDHLAVAAQDEMSGGNLHLWRMDDGKLLKKVPTKRLNDRQATFSHNGLYAAAVMDQKLVVLDMKKGKQVAEMQAPTPDTGFVAFTFVAALAFSPDTSELAAIITGKDAAHHLVVWSANGKIVEHHDLALTIAAGYYLPGGIQWAPDGRGWLLHGDYYFDRSLKALAYILQPPVQHNYPHRFLDNEHLLASTGDFENRQLVAVAIPRQAIVEAAESLNSGAEALLKPGDTVNLKVEVGASLFAQGNDVVQSLTDNLTKRLAAGGLKVGPEGKVTLKVTYSEAAGEDLRVVEGSPFGPRGRETGQTVKETVGRLEAEMTTGGKSIFKTSIKRGNPYRIDAAAINDEAVRKAMFDGISFMLTTMQLPYFVPADEKALRLPVSVSLRE